MILYTAGYRQWPYFKFKKLLEEINNPLVMDVRYNPFTKLPFWNKNELIKDLGDQYFHNFNFGNKNYYEAGVINIVDLKRGMNKISELFKSNQDTLLLCACEDIKICHRLVLANKITEEFDLEVKHL